MPDPLKLPGGIDLSMLMEQAQPQQPKSRFAINATGVKLQWGAALDQQGNPVFQLQVENLDGSIQLICPMNEQYLNNLMRQLSDVREALRRAQRQLNGVGETDALDAGE
jgi:hypothetical protein